MKEEPHSPLNGGMVIKMEAESSPETEEDETLPSGCQVKEENDAGDTILSGTALLGPCQIYFQRCRRG